MSDNCCGSTNLTNITSRYKKVLLAVLVINLSMFFVEIFAGVQGGSVALMADALDFLGDSATYIITLVVLGMGIRWRASAALLKGVSMGAVGVWVIYTLIEHALNGTIPSAAIMGQIGLLALIANVVSALLLYHYRDGDSNMRSVWICSRNDAIGNIAVMIAAGAVFYMGHGWPDLIVALIMAGLSLHGAWEIITGAVQELRNN